MLWVHARSILWPSRTSVAATRFANVGLRFAALSLLVNLAVLALAVFTGVGFAAFFVLNGYLLGREYFELAAMRHLPLSQAVEPRRQRSFDVFIAGMIIAGFVAIPLLSLLTPLFATAFMTRMMKLAY